VPDDDFRISLDDFSGLPCHVLNLHRHLVDLITPIGLRASLDATYSGAVFGRDSLRVGLDLVPWFPDLIQEILVSLAWLQGDHTDDEAEEEPGKLPHEYRPRRIGQRTLTAAEASALEKLRAIWKNQPDIVYYGAVDATPQFIRLMSMAARLHGPQILQIGFVHKSGGVRTLADSVRLAALWIEQAIRRSDLTLLEFQRKNPNGHRFQVLRDGVTSYIHADTGDLANTDSPIASLEVQGLAIDALRMAADLLADAMPECARRWLGLADAVRDETLKRFWLPEHGYFAMAVDRDPRGGPRPVRTRSSLSAELLETSIFDALPEPERSALVSAIVQDMYGPEFLTAAGIRCLAVSHRDLVPYWDFQGALATWITITDSFARGLRRQGLTTAAIDQENRILNALNMADDFVEYLYVDAEGRVDYDPYQRHAGARRTLVIPSKDVPTRNQAWTISAALRAMLSRAWPTAERRPGSVPLRPPTRLTPVPAPVPLLRTRRDAIEAWPDDYAFRIDTQAGLSALRAHWQRKGIRLYHHADPANAG
jgi:glycogen debranching enzyme